MNTTSRHAVKGESSEEDVDSTHTLDTSEDEDGQRHEESISPLSARSASAAQPDDSSPLPGGSWSHVTYNPSQPSIQTDDAPKRPRRRTIRACEGCRKKKIACNGKQPCAACVLRSRDCVYTALTVTGRPSKGALKLLQHQIAELEKEVETLRGKLSSHGIHTHSHKANDDVDVGQNCPKDAQIVTGAQTRQEARHSAQSSATFGPDAFSQRRDSLSATREDDYFYIQGVFTNKLKLDESERPDTQTGNTINESLKRKMLMLHTSSKLDPLPESVYMTGIGMAAGAFRLSQAIAGKRHSDQRCFDINDKSVMDETVLGHEVPDAYEGLNMPSKVDLHWPSREREDQMCNVYFRLVHPTMPILSREILTLQRSHAFRSVFEDDPIWLSIMLGIFIGAARYIPNERANCLRWWNARMQLGTFDVSYSRTMGGLQNFLLTSDMGFEMFTPAHVVWLSVGVVLRSMQARGFHREKVIAELPHDTEWKDIARCLWWTAQKHDLDLCYALGYPPAALVFDVMPPKTSSKISPMPYFRAMVKGLKIKATSIDFHANRNPAHRQKQYEEADEWLAELRTFLPFVPKEKDDEKFFACAKLWLSSYSISSSSRRYGITSALSNIFRKDGKGCWSFHLREDYAEYASGLGSFERDELDNCFKSLRSTIRNSATVCEALVRRSNQGICFVDHGVGRTIFQLFSDACLLYFVEMTLGKTDFKLLEYAEIFSQTIRLPAAEIGSPLWHIGLLTSNMLRHWRIRVAKRAGLHAQSAQSTNDKVGDQSENTQNWSGYSVPSNENPDVVYSGSGFTFVRNEAASGQGFTMPFHGLSQGQGSSQAQPVTCQGPFQPCAGKTQKAEQGSQFTAATATESGLAPSMEYTQPASEPFVSPDTKIWNDFLQSEMMLLDNKDAFSGGQGVLPDSLFFESALLTIPTTTTPNVGTMPFDFASTSLHGTGGTFSFGQTPTPGAPPMSGYAPQHVGGEKVSSTSGAAGYGATYADPRTEPQRTSLSWPGPIVGPIVSPPQQHTEDSRTRPGEPDSTLQRTELEQQVMADDPSIAASSQNPMAGAEFWAL